jgi:tetratricopeptide (TPR) repeat protein
VVREHPRNPEAYYFLGFAQYGLGRLPLAKASLATAVELNPGFVKAKMLLAQTYLDARDFEEAERLAAALTPPGEDAPADVVLVRAGALLGLGKSDQARQLLETLTSVSPQHSRAQELLGRCYLAEKKPGPALAALRRAIEADPANESALRLAAQLLVAQERVGDAIALVEAQDKRSGESAERRVLLGRLYGVDGNRERARTHLNRAIELDPDAVEAYLLLAGLHTGPDSARKALADVERAVDRQPGYLQGWILKGSIHDALEEWDAANAAYRRALEAAPDAVAALNNLAWNLSERGGNIDEALKFAERATELMPKSPSVNDTLGWIYIKKGVYMKAVSHLEYAAEVLTETPAVHYHLGKAYAELGKTTKAVASLERALQLSKDFEGAEDARELRERLR